MTLGAQRGGYVAGPRVDRDYYYWALGSFTLACPKATHTASGAICQKTAEKANGHFPGTNTLTWKYDEQMNIDDKSSVKASTKTRLTRNYDNYFSLKNQPDDPNPYYPIYIKDYTPSTGEVGSTNRSNGLSETINVPGFNPAYSMIQGHFRVEDYNGKKDAEGDNYRCANLAYDAYTHKLSCSIDSEHEVALDISKCLASSNLGYKYPDINFAKGNLYCAADPSKKGEVKEYIEPSKIPEPTIYQYYLDGAKISESGIESKTTFRLGYDKDTGVLSIFNNSGVRKGSISWENCYANNKDVVTLIFDWPRRNQDHSINYAFPPELRVVYCDKLGA